MSFPMPPSFPEDPFLKFGGLAGHFFPSSVSAEALGDPLMRGLHFDRAWRAVRFRYRLCAECNEEYRTLLAGGSELWREWGEDEEQNYKLERCIYIFFMGGLSVFESLSFCLYFLGAALRPEDFPHVSKLRRIDLKVTGKAFATAFPQATITRHLAELPRSPAFVAIEAIRNIVAHRLSGRRNIRVWGTRHPDGTHTNTRQETWHLPGLDNGLTFDDRLLQRHLDEIAGLLTALVGACLEFVESYQAAGALP